MGRVQLRRVEFPVEYHAHHQPPSTILLTTLVDSIPYGTCKTRTTQDAFVETILRARTDASLGAHKGHRSHNPNPRRKSASLLSSDQNHEAKGKVKSTLNP